MKARKQDIFLQTMSLTFLLMVVGLPMTHAEGPINTGAGADFRGGGVDRVVETTPTGFIGVSENVQLAGAYPHPNPNQDNAASYLGCLQGQLVAEGGITWYMGDLPSRGPKGWGAFLNVGGAASTNDDNQSTPQYFHDGAWQPWRDYTVSGGPNGGTCNHTISINIDTTDGSIYLYVSGAGYFYAAQKSPAANPGFYPDTTTAKTYTTNYATPFDTSHLDTCLSKRVVAMNRGPSISSDPHWDDNSWMYAAVSDVRWIRWTTTGTEARSWAYTDPTSTDRIPITQETSDGPSISGTGFDSFDNSSHRAKDLLDQNGFPTRDSKYRVNFPDTYCLPLGRTYATPQETQLQNEYIAREQVTDSWHGSVTINNQASQISRYTQEYVEIWLRKGTYVAPLPVRARSRHIP